MGRDAYQLEEGQAEGDEEGEAGEGRCRRFGGRRLLGGLPLQRASSLLTETRMKGRARL